MTAEEIQERSDLRVSKRVERWLGRCGERGTAEWIVECVLRSLLSSGWTLTEVIEFCYRMQLTTDTRPGHEFAVEWLEAFCVYYDFARMQCVRPTTAESMAAGRKVRAAASMIQF